MKELKFTGIYLKCVKFQCRPEKLNYVIAPFQGLHEFFFYNIDLDIAQNNGWYLADITYNIETKTYSIDSIKRNIMLGSLPTTFEIPGREELIIVMTQVNTTLRAANL